MSRGRLITAVLAWAVIAPSHASADLTTFGYGNARRGSSPLQAAIAPTSVPRLRIAWRTSVDGAITGQPLVADRVRSLGRLRNLVLVATEHGVVIALDADRGTVVWKHRLGARRIEPDCQASPDGRFGVTGTMVVDRHTGRVFAVDVDGRAWALDLGSGHVVPGWPVRVHSSTGGDFVWSALSISRGWLYVPIASLCDSGIYNGGVAAIQLGRPTRIKRWQTTAGTTAFGGGIWGWGGVAIDDRTADVYAATGNSLGTPREDEGHAESIVRLSSGLKLTQANDPLRGPFGVEDRDFGTTPVLIDAPSCPQLAVVINKDGELFVYDRNRISSGPRQRLAVAADSSDAIPLYGIPAYDPVTRTLVLVSPSAPPGSVLRPGVQAFRLASDCQLVPRWQHVFDPPDAGSAPTIAGGVVYIGSGRNGWVRAFRLRDGQQLWARGLSRKAIFAAPAVDRGTLFVGDWSGRVFALRPGPVG